MIQLLYFCGTFAAHQRWRTIKCLSCEVIHEGWFVCWEPCAIGGDKVWRNSRTKGETAPAHNGRGSDESALLRQQKPQTTARTLTGTCLSSRCTLVSIYQEYSQMQCTSMGTTPAIEKLENTPSGTGAHRSSSKKSQTGRKTWAQSASWTLAKGCWIHRGGERHVEKQDLTSDFSL